MSQSQREQLKVAREHAVLVALRLPEDRVDLEERFEELQALASTAGAEVVGILSQRRRKPVGRTFLGKGKVEELARLIEMTKATIAIFDHDLTPAQIRNLEKELSVKIIDRSELILDIFARRAMTHAAKLQVEIAQLEYTYPRLRAMWDHLGQVTGGAPVGIGTRGPGEQQLEIDRRLVQRRLKQLRRELDGIHARKEREVSHRNEDHFTVGLVGYTNAGKSSIFNRLTAGGAFAHDKLFATLSTRVEQWSLGDGNSVLLSDTVGFIRDLPHHLVASFRSTLEETVHCQLLLVVVDVNDQTAHQQFESVLRTLDEIGATGQPRQLVLNKVDQLERQDDLLCWLRDHPDALPVSAETREGLDRLTELVRDASIGPKIDLAVTLATRDARAVDFLERRTPVTNREYGDGIVTIQTSLGLRQASQLLSHTRNARVGEILLSEALSTLWPPPTVLGDSCRIPPHRTHESTSSWTSE
ncbi:MAG: GTPase HflX [Planctomycetes bacterium]|nr:GTPase HflX [Planctomycetota bacterium]MCP4839826.1 GTPase HflX [Planctomycetota bacterium]